MPLSGFFKSMFGSKALPQKKKNELSIELLHAAATNDVSKIKLLQAQGADINFRVSATFSPTKIYIYSEHRYPPLAGETNSLMAALGCGAFDAALYLAQQAGIDSTYEQENPYSRDKKKALDFLLTDNAPEPSDPLPALPDVKAPFNDKAKSQPTINNNWPDFYTPEQRVQIFDALVANVENPLELLSERTVKNAISFARAEIIPKLVSIGVQLSEDDFVSAACPYQRTDRAIQIMEAILPHVKDVNVMGFRQKNAGHEVARILNLEAFKWLEERGLDKNAIADTNVPTYAHVVAESANIGEESKNGRFAFIQHLADNGYNLQHEGNERHGGSTPTDLAFEVGHIDLGIAMLNMGLPIKQNYLADAVRAQYFSNTTIDEVINLIEIYSQRNALTDLTVNMAYRTMAQKIQLNDKKIPLYVPVAKYLTERGFKLDPSYMGEDASGAALLLEKIQKTSSSFNPSQTKDLSCEP